MATSFRQSIQKRRSGFSGARIDQWVRLLFGSNAAVSILVLGLITLFLFKEGIGFFPQNLKNLQLYRLAGLEYVDIIRPQIDGHTALSRQLQSMRLKELEALLQSGKSNEQAAELLAPLDAFITEFDESIEELRSLFSDLSDVAAAIKEKAKVNEDLMTEHEQLLQQGKQAQELKIEPIDFAREIEPLRATFPVYKESSTKLHDELLALLVKVPDSVLPGLQAQVLKFKADVHKYVDGFDLITKELQAWDQNTPVPWTKALNSFLLGPRWLTASFWQDWYGVLPLLTGSILVAFVALFIAVPFAVCAAVYVSEIASPTEQRIIKPVIEFIAAIPSVVLGFFGIAVLGETIRALTQIPWLAEWVPFFPISERLNVFTAGVLLALMAIPTIFSLSEDALNNVPRVFKEGSYALGSTRFQTIVRVLVPASLSGIVSAVLLGFGRVIGETMVVLLCAGNRIQVPDFTQGLGAFFQPVHTMTGIIAQEMGEVPVGSIHYRSLFTVGILLFVLALLINYLAQYFVRRFKISIG